MIPLPRSRFLVDVNLHGNEVGLHLSPSLPSEPCSAHPMRTVVTGVMLEPPEIRTSIWEEQVHKTAIVVRRLCQQFLNDWQQSWEVFPQIEVISKLRTKAMNTLAISQTPPPCESRDKQCGGRLSKQFIGGGGLHILGMHNPSESITH